MAGKSAGDYVQIPEAAAANRALAIAGIRNTHAGGARPHAAALDGGVAPELDRGERAVRTQTMEDPTAVDDPALRAEGPRD